MSFGLRGCAQTDARSAIVGSAGGWPLGIAAVCAEQSSRRGVGTRSSVRSHANSEHIGAPMVSGRWLQIVDAVACMVVPCTHERHLITSASRRANVSEIGD